MQIRRNTFMGMIREEHQKTSTKSLINRYKQMNQEGKKSAYDELRARGKTKEANLLRYGRATKPTRQRQNSFNFGLPKIRF